MIHSLFEKKVKVSNPPARLTSRSMIPRNHSNSWSPYTQYNEGNRSTLSRAMRVWSTIGRSAAREGKTTRGHE